MNDSYRAAREAAAFIDRSDRLRMEFSGAKAAETLNGLFTNDISKLAPGMGCYAAALTNKGKVVADVRVFARATSFIVDTSAAAAPGFAAMIRKYVNPRLAAYRDVSAEFGCISVVGPKAIETLAAAGGADPSSLLGLAQYGHVDHKGGFWARVPDFGGDTFDVIAPVAAQQGIRAALARAGAVELDVVTAEVLRIEAGRPAWGADMDENTLAQEAALDRADLAAISFDKGCYTGQETVARVHFRGHVNRVLRGLRADQLPASGATLHASDGAEVGHVRSVAVSPRFGAIALAYVRREVEDGTGVIVRGPDGDTAAKVVAVPFT